MLPVRRPRLTPGRGLPAAVLAAVLAVTAGVLVPSGVAAAAPTILRTHPHEGTSGAVPAAAAESYASRTGTAAAYTATPPAADGATSIRFAGTAATYFEDASLTSSTGQLVWSAPLQVPSLPASGGSDRFLAARTTSAALGSVAVGATGQLQIRNGGGTVQATGAAALAAGTWYRVEAMFANSQATVRLFDATGALLDTVGPTAITAGTPSRLRTGATTTGGPVLIDRVQVADDWLTAVTPPPPPPPPPANPCGLLPYDSQNLPQYQHVVVLMEENWSYADFAASNQAPYLSGLAAGCGDEVNFHAATHPSQPNYMAATSGVASHVGTMVSNDNIFNQLQNAGMTWKSYEESMPSPCQGTSTSIYKPGHNPAYYYSDLRSPDTCATNDLPMSPTLDNDIANDTLPNYSWVTPNECDEFYWVKACPNTQAQRIPTGDDWLKRFVPRLTALPSYQAGQTLIIITFDEGRESTNTNYVDCTDPAYYSTHADCQVPTVVISPYIVPGTQDSSDQNHYSLLGTTEDVLGLPRLGRAVGASSMRTALGF